MHKLHFPIFFSSLFTSSSTHIIFPQWKPPCSSGKILSSQFCLSLGNIFRYSVWRLLKKNKLCFLIPARTAASTPNLMKDCHQLSKRLSYSKVGDGLILCHIGNTHHSFILHKGGTKEGVTGNCRVIKLLSWCSFVHTPVFLKMLNICIK